MPSFMEKVVKFNLCDRPQWLVLGWHSRPVPVIPRARCLADGVDAHTGMFSTGSLTFHVWNV